jgi:hypothetical protein
MLSSKGLIVGLIGAFFLGLGGAIILHSTSFLFYFTYNRISLGNYLVTFDIPNFAGFLFIGIGILLIVKSAKSQW